MLPLLVLTREHFNSGDNSILGWSEKLGKYSAKEIKMLASPQRPAQPINFYSKALMVLLFQIFILAFDSQHFETLLCCSTFSRMVFDSPLLATTTYQVQNKHSVLKFKNEK